MDLGRRRAAAEPGRRARAGVAQRGDHVHRLLWLQPRVGNRAVAAVVQRDLAATPLTTGQAALAVSFYRGKPDLYTADIVTKIQVAVKSSPSGQPDAPMAQGVARFQSEAVLKVDGMAGPRTLPRLFESGLATKVDRKEFVATGKAVGKAWQTLATAEARADKLFEGVKTQLDKEKVPTPTHGVDTLGKAAGVFSPRQWRMTFDRAALTGETTDDDAVQSVAGTVYHEARHAEQSHKMARMRATKLSELGILQQNDRAARIQAEMKVPPEIAQDAAGNPLPHSIEFVTAAQQYESSYGSGRAHHQQAEDNAPSTPELRAAQAEAKANPTPANRAKAARLLAAFKAYHDLPTEADAFATEIDFTATWDEETALGGG